jgi:hypothetical protein
MARKHKFTAEEVLEAWEAYKEQADNRTVQEVSAGKVLRVSRPEVYTLEFFLITLPLSRQAWSEYSKKKQYREVVGRINEIVFARKKQAMVNGEGHVSGLIFDMKANYGINDKTIIDANIDGTIDVTLNLGGPKENEGSEEAD